MEWLDSIEAEWRDAVTRWESLMPDFQRAIELHWANRDKAIALGTDEFNRWQAQLDHALQVKTAIEMLQESIAATSDWAKSTFGLGGMRKMQRAGLGAIPLIPVAIIVGSIATVTGVIYALNTYNDDLQRKWDYVNLHPEMTPKQVTDLLEANAPIPGIGSVSSTIFWIVAGGALLFFGPELLKGWRK